MKTINILYSSYGYESPFIKFYLPDFKLKRIEESDLDDDSSFIYYCAAGSNLEYYIGNHDDRFTGHGFLYDTTEKVKDIIRYGRGHIVVAYMQEGHVEQRSYKGLHNYLKKYNIPANKVIFVASNLNGKVQYDNFCRKFKLLTQEKLHILEVNHMLESMADVCYHYYTDNFNLPDETKDKSTLTSGINIIDDIKSLPLRKKYFLCYNRNMRYYRIALLSKFKKLGLFDKGMISMGPYETEGYKEDVNLHLGWENEENWWVENKKLRSEIKTIQRELKQLQPLAIEGEEVWQTNGLWPGFDFKETYQKVYFDVVTESCFATDSLYCSEKIYKPISQLLPFVVLGPCGILKKVKEQGFKTFSPFIDESYDVEENHEKRFLMLVDEVNRLCSFSLEELHDWYYSILDTLEFNQKHLIEYEPVDHKNCYGFMHRIIR